MKRIRALDRLFVFLAVSALIGVAGCGDSGGQAAVAPRPDEGVSVVYQVRFPAGQDPAMSLQQAADALRARARARGAAWHIATPGWDEIEIVAPAPYDDKEAVDITVADVRSVVESGTLSFHIAADPHGEGDDAAPPKAELQRLRAAFREGGEHDVGEWRWVAIKDPESVIGSTDVSLTDMDSQGVADAFAGRPRMVVERRYDSYYALLSDSPESAMTPEQDWTIETVKRGVDNRTGLPIVVFRLDEAGGEILERLTSANTDRVMAVVVNGEIFMAPIVAGTIAQDVAVSTGGGFSEADTAAMVSVFQTKPLPVTIDGPPAAVMSFRRPKPRDTP